MTGFMDWNLIHFFNFYLAVAFLFSTTRRIKQYQAILGLVRAVPGRWPRLFELIKAHATVFLTWATVLPRRARPGVAAAEPAGVAPDLV